MAVPISAFTPPQIVPERVDGPDQDCRGATGRGQPRGRVPELGDIAGVLDEVMLGLQVINDERECKAEHKQNQSPDRIIERDRDIKQKQVRSL